MEEEQLLSQTEKDKIKMENDAASSNNTKIREQRVKAVDIILSHVSEDSQALLDTYIKQHTDH